MTTLFENDTMPAPHRTNPARTSSTRAASAVVFMCAALFSLAAQAQSFTWFQNRWQPEKYIHAEYERVQAGQIKPGWHSAQWTVELVPGTNFYRIRNRWKSDQYLHIEYGALQGGPVQGAWHSAMWTLERVPETNFIRVRNRWKRDQFLHIEYGGLQSGPIQGGWWSAMWSMKAQP